MIPHIEDALRVYTLRNAKSPTKVFLGFNQWRELRQRAAAHGVEFPFGDEQYIDEACRPEWEGYPVYRVDAMDFIQFTQ